MSRASNDFAPWLGVFETVRVVSGRVLFLEEHRAELARAMAALGLNHDFDFAAAARELPKKTGRWRWIVAAGETTTRFTEEEDAAPGPVALSVSPVRVGSNNWDARFKTLSYLAHAQAGKTASTPEVVLLNEHGHVASASRGNLFWRRGDRLCTPAHEAGCRCGVVRALVLKREKVEVGNFPVSDLLEAEEIFVTNSMKGIVSASDWQGRALGESPWADRLREEYAAAVAEQVGFP